MARLSDVAEIVMGQSPPSSTYNEDGIGLPFFQGKGDFGSKFPIPRKFCSAPKKVAKEGDILISVRAPVGPVNLCNTECCIGRGLAAIRSLAIDTLFLYFNLVWLEPRIAELGTGSTFKQINKAQLTNIEVNKLKFLPSEQRKIAAVLSLVQRAIEQQERLIQLTTELKKALMRKLFTEGTRGEPQKMTEIGPVPESWEVVRLGDVLTLAQYGLSARGNENGNYPILRMTNQINGKIVPNNLQWIEIDETQFEKFSVKQGDILFNRTNSFELVGRTAIFDIEGDYVFASYLIRLRVNRTRLNPYFLNQYFNSDSTQQRLKSIATRAVSQSNISATRLKNFPIPLPEIDEQQRIIEILDIVDSKITNHEQRRTALQSLFRTLLHQLMTAQIRVADLDMEELGIGLPDNLITKMPSQE